MKIAVDYGLENIFFFCLQTIYVCYRYFYIPIRDALHNNSIYVGCDNNFFHRSFKNAEKVVV